MSGYKPIQFVKATDQAATPEETGTGSDSKLPLTSENVMAEKDKVAAALLRGENYDTAEAFEPAGASKAMKPDSMPAAAAHAISAGLVPPTSASGLEDGVEPMDIDKEKIEEDKMTDD